MGAPPHRVHRLIDALIASPELQATFKEHPNEVFDRFEIEPAHRTALQEATQDAMRGIGVHPSMQFKFLIATGRPPVKMIDVSHYLDRL